MAADPAPSCPPTLSVHPFLSLGPFGTTLGSLAEAKRILGVKLDIHLCPPYGRGGGLPSSRGWTGVPPSGSLPGGSWPMSSSVQEPLFHIKDRVFITTACLSLPGRSGDLGSILSIS